MFYEIDTWMSLLNSNFAGDIFDFFFETSAASSEFFRRFRFFSSDFGSTGLLPLPESGKEISAAATDSDFLLGLSLSPESRLFFVGDRSRFVFERSDSDFRTFSDVRRLVSNSGLDELRDLLDSTRSFRPRRLETWLPDARSISRLAAIRSANETGFPPSPSESLGY
jgi:hypothetical protein